MCPIVQELCNKIMSGLFKMPSHVSKDARDLLHAMLTVDPDQRITFEEVRSSIGGLDV